eukprot:3528304-Pyramimonas_sp.AAC.1
MAGVALPRHRRGCAGGGLPIRFGLAKRGKRGSSSTPQGLRWGWSPYPFRARKARHAVPLHFLDTTGGALGVVSLSVSGSRSVAGVPFPRRHRGTLGVVSPSASVSKSVASVPLPRHHKG